MGTGMGVAEGLRPGGRCIRVGGGAPSGRPVEETPLYAAPRNFVEEPPSRGRSPMKLRDRPRGGSRRDGAPSGAPKPRRPPKTIESSANLIEIKKNNMLPIFHRSTGMSKTSRESIKILNNVYPTISKPTFSSTGSETESVRARRSESHPQSPNRVTELAATGAHQVSQAAPFHRPEGGATGRLEGTRGEAQAGEQTQMVLIKGKLGQSKAIWSCGGGFTEAKPGGLGPQRGPS